MSPSARAAVAPPRWLALGCCAVMGAVGCGRSEADSAPPVPAPPARSVAVDNTEPGELAEGDEAAFGLPVPRDMKVTARFPDTVYARGKVPFEPLANYVRQRVSAARVDTGPTKTVFVDAALKRSPAKQVRVEVSYRGGIAELVVRDRSPRPVKPGLSDAERWRAAGVTPDGRVLPEANE